MRRWYGSRHRGFRESLGSTALVADVKTGGRIDRGAGQLLGIQQTGGRLLCAEPVLLNG